MKLKDFAVFCACWAGKGVVFDFQSEVEQKGYSVAMHAILDNTRLLSIGCQSFYPFEDAIQRTLDILANRK